MHAEIVISGSGGQGVLVIGRLLAEAGFFEGKHVVWSPSYSAEKRGGIVSCSVTISDETIGSLFSSHPTIGIAMNLTAAKNLEQIIQIGGILAVNQIENEYDSIRTDIKYILVPANLLAMELGTESAANIIILGALLGVNQVISISTVVKVIEQLFGSNAKAIEMNKQALFRGSKRYELKSAEVKLES